MRASELLSSRVVDELGHDLGPVRDIRVARDDLRVLGLVVGTGPLAGAAHAWGYVEGHARGPWLLCALAAPARRRARFIPADRVRDWGPGLVKVAAEETAPAPRQMS